MSSPFRWLFVIGVAASHVCGASGVAGAAAGAGAAGAVRAARVDRAAGIAHVAAVARASSAATSGTFTPGELLAIPVADERVELDAAGRPTFAHAGVGAILAARGLRRAAWVGHGEDRTRVLALWSDRPSFDPVAAARALRATGRFRAVVPNYHARLFATFPDDPDLVAQWYIDSAIDGDVQLPQAWDHAQGDPAVAIGIMDTGVDLGHPDLAAKIWTNPGEVPGNGVDDDGNGYVDDVHGWDFGNDDADPNPHAMIDPIGLDVGFHGTFVAGIAAAATGNATGIAGAGWNCSILPLKVANSAGEITSEAIAAAFQYAAGAGVSVLNMSFGAPPDSGVAEFFQALVDDATAAGVLCVAAAGNDGVDALSYPAANDNVIAVAAIDETNTRSDFSNFGPWVDIAAPGSFMWSSISRNYEVDAISQLFYILIWGWNGVDPYMYGDGTSFASPLVSGVAGLVRARWPYMTPWRVTQQLVTSGDDIGDASIGPKLNALRAVQQPVDTTDDGIASAPELEAGNPVRNGTSLRFRLARPGETTLRVYDPAGRLVRVLLEADIAAGAHTASWDGRDGNGERVRQGVYFVRLESPAGTAVRKLTLLR